MVSPPGWSEPGQTPEFTEYSVVVRGALRVETGQGEFRVAADVGGTGYHLRHRSLMMVVGCSLEGDYRHVSTSLPA